MTEGRGFRPTARRGNVTKRFDIDTILLYIFLEKQTLKFKVKVLADECIIDLHPLCPTMSDPNCKHSWLLNKIQRHISRKELNQTVFFQSTTIIVNIQIKGFVYFLLIEESVFICGKLFFFFNFVVHNNK